MNSNSLDKDPHNRSSQDAIEEYDNLASMHKDALKQLDLVERLENDDLPKLAKRMKNCLRIMGQYQCECGKKIFAVHHRCLLRICPSCMKKRMGIIEDKYNPHIQNSKKLTFLTLTIRNTKYISKEILNQLKKDFKFLRRKYLGEYIRSGGIWRLEVTYNETAKTWHPHIHALIDMDWVDQKNISSWWAEIRKDNSFIVDIRKADKEAIEYVTKYMNKISDNFPLGDYMRAIHGFRIVQPFGDWIKNKTKEKKEQETTEQVCENNVTDDLETKYSTCTFWKKDEKGKSFLNIVMEKFCECRKIMRLNIDTIFGLSVLDRWILYN